MWAGLRAGLSVLCWLECLCFVMLKDVKCLHSHLWHFTSVAGTPRVWLSLSFQLNNGTILCDDRLQKGKNKNKNRQQKNPEAVTSLQVQAWESHSITFAAFHWDHCAFKTKQKWLQFFVGGMENLHCKNKMEWRTNVKTSCKGSLPQPALRLY